MALHTHQCMACTVALENIEGYVCEQRCMEQPLNDNAFLAAVPCQRKAKSETSMVETASRRVCYIDHSPSDMLIMIATVTVIKHEAVFSTNKLPLL